MTYSKDPNNKNVLSEYGKIKSESLPTPKKNELFAVNQSVRDEILNYQKHPTTSNETYKDTLRAMLSFFSQYTYLTPENEVKQVKCIFANPERSISKQFQENNIILPVISVAQVTTEEDQKRVRYNSSLVHEVVWDDKKQRAVRVVSLPSKPAKFKYKVNIWAKYRANLDQILEQIRLSFSPDALIVTKNSHSTKAFLESEADFGDDKVDDKQDRLIKKELTVVVETYIPSPKFLLTSTGKITKTKIDAYIDGVD